MSRRSSARPSLLDRYLWHIVAGALVVLMLSVGAIYVGGMRRDARTLATVEALASALTQQQNAALAAGQQPITPPAAVIVRNPAVMRQPTGVATAQLCPLASVLNMPCDYTTSTTTRRTR